MLDQHEETMLIPFPPHAGVTGIAYDTQQIQIQNNILNDKRF